MLENSYEVGRKGRDDRGTQFISLPNPAWVVLVDPSTIKGARNFGVRRSSCSSCSRQH